MTDANVKKKLAQFVALGNELDAEAKRRYGPDGLLFHEADGSAMIMDCLPDDGSDEFSQDHVRFSVYGVQWGAGAF